MLCVFWFCLDYFVLVLFAFIVLDLVLFSSAMLRDWLGRPSSKLPILCRVGRRTLISQ